MARVLIAGATSAIAAEMARIHARRGDSLFLLARSAVRLSARGADLGAAVAGSIQADLDDTGSSGRHVAAAIDTLGGLDVAVIAHGLLGDQLYTERSWEAAEGVIRTNLLSAVSLLLPIASYFESAPRAAGAAPGHIAALSSVAGERGRPRNYTYGASKAALGIYLQGVRSRLYQSGTRVHVFKLGPVDTPMTADHPKNPLFARPEAVARRLVAAIDAGVAEAYVPSYWRPIMSIVRSLPEPVFQRVGFLSGR